MIGKNKGDRCQRIPRIGTYCGTHKKYEDVNLQPMNMCEYIYPYGQYKGKRCQIIPKIGPYCGTHKNYKRIVKSNEIDHDQEKIRKNNYYKSQKLHNRLYGRTVEVPNDYYAKPCLNYTKFTKKICDYKRITICGKSVSVHILSYALSHGIFIEEIPRVNECGKILEICHGEGCDISCIEPSHLSLKTKSINNYEDKIRDKTLINGERHYKCLLTEDLAKQIKYSKGNGSPKERAEKFGVSMCTIYDIDCDRSWTHIPKQDGSRVDTTDKREKWSERNKRNKERIYTQDDWVLALKKLREKSVDSEKIHQNVSTPCHLCQGYLNKDGYGKIGFNGYQHMAHILGCESKYGRKRDEKNEIVRHLCDTPQCCNPDHLKFGTHQQNAVDALTYSKNCKLHEIQVKEIKNLLPSYGLKELSEMYHVSIQTIKDIRNEKIWIHITI